MSRNKEDHSDSGTTDATGWRQDHSQCFLAGKGRWDLEFPSKLEPGGAVLASLQ